MFGYVVVNKPELKFKEFDIYQSYYCGLCQTLKNKYGFKGQVSLNYDMTFLAMLLSLLYDGKTNEVNERCVIHPMKKRLKYFNEYIDYAAQMTIVLAYFKCEDDWLDEKSLTKQTYKKLINHTYENIKKLYPQKIMVVEQELHQINQYEKNEHENIDDLAGCFGRVMGEICAFRDDIWHDDLYEFGFYLGKFIYILDAYDDIEEDMKKDTFNPLKKELNDEDFDDKCYILLEMMISRAANVFECLPITENIEILRNIIYSGVWTKYKLRKMKRAEDKS